MSDPLFPAAAALPLSAHGGGSIPRLVTAVRGPVPLVVALAVRPIEGGKHESTETKYHQNRQTKYVDDGTEQTDTVTQEFGDS